MRRFNDSFQLALSYLLLFLQLRLMTTRCINKLICEIIQNQFQKNVEFHLKVSDWIDEEATIDTELTILESKLKELKDLTATLFARIREHTDRPEALEALNKMLNTSEYFLGKAKNRYIFIKLFNFLYKLCMYYV